MYYGNFCLLSNKIMQQEKVLFVLLQIKIEDHCTFSW